MSIPIPASGGSGAEGRDTNVPGPGGPSRDMIEIGVPVAEIAARRERVGKTRRFERPDRVAVIPSIGTRFLVPRMGVRFRNACPDDSRGPVL